MPNWCNGWLNVIGSNPTDVENFCKHFLFDSDNDKTIKAKGKYFARSFIHEDWKDFKKNTLGKNDVSFAVDFAWSCSSCMIDGYPQDNPKDLITLEEASKLHNVKVIIETEEDGCAFAEFITCDKGDMVENRCEDLYPMCEICEERKKSCKFREDEDEDEEICLCDDCALTELQKLVKDKAKEIKERRKNG